jgi:quercetin dioxygenase-like cupin family protein
MDRNAFIESLTKEGFPDAVVVTREANVEMEMHEHPFEAKALILEGEMSIRMDDEVRAYRVGDVFHLPANKPHAERFGPNGVTYLVGRKQSGTA